MLTKVSIVLHKYKGRLIWLSLLLALGLGTSVIAQEGAHQAAVVVSLEDGQVLTRCVAFDEEQISGYELLNRTGLDLKIDVIGMGASVCQIQGSGCPADDCFCQCKGGGPCLYWSYWHLDEGAWRYSQIGAGSYQVSDGDVEAWVWGVGAPNEAPEPPKIGFAEICQIDLSATTSGDEVIAAATAQLLPAATAAGAEGSEMATLPEATISPGSNSSSDVVRDSAWLSYLLVGLAAIGIGTILISILRRQRKST